MRDRISWWKVAALIAVVAAAGCTEDNPLYQPGPDLPEQCRAGSEVTETFERFERPHKVDLWFLIADTEGMESYQQALADSMPSLAGHLDGADIDVRAAVSTMDLVSGPGLAPVVGGPEGCDDNTSPVADSSDDNWLNNLACNLQQGEDGDRRRQPMEMVRQSLDDDGFGQFRRDDARLVMVMVTNQDDCSGDGFDDDPNTPIHNLCSWQADQLTDVEQWADDLRDTTVVQEGISLVAISGPAGDIAYEEGEDVRRVCSSSLSNAYPAARLRDATREFGDQGRFASICVYDFVDHLYELATREVLRDEVTLCASEPMAHEPLQVIGVDDGGGSDDIPFGPGFEFAGATDGCDNGAIRLRGEGARGIEQVEMTYCGL